MTRLKRKVAKVIACYQGIHPIALLLERDCLKIARAELQAVRRMVRKMQGYSAGTIMREDGGKWVKRDDLLAWLEGRMK